MQSWRRSRPDKGACGTRAEPITAIGCLFRDAASDRVEETLMNARAYAESLGPADAANAGFAGPTAGGIRSDAGIPPRARLPDENPLDDCESLLSRIEELRDELARLEVELHQTVVERDILRNAHRILSVTVSARGRRKPELGASHPAHPSLTGSATPRSARTEASIEHAGLRRRSA